MGSWTSLEGALVSGAAAASWGEHEVQVFAIHEDGQIWNRYWDGEAWHPWEPMGGAFRGHPAASAREADRIDVMAIDVSGELRHRFWNGTEWVPWRAVPGAPREGRAVTCSWTGARLDVFVFGADGGLWYAALDA